MKRREILHLQRPDLFEPGEAGDLMRAARRALIAKDDARPDHIRVAVATIALRGAVRIDGLMRLAEAPPPATPPPPSAFRRRPMLARGGRHA